MRNRFVKVTRETTKNPRATYTYYKPVELRNGNLYALCNPEELGADGFMMGMKGFDNIADAWRVIDKIEDLEHDPPHPERCDCPTCRPELYVG